MNALDEIALPRRGSVGIYAFRLPGPEIRIKVGHGIVDPRMRAPLTWDGRSRMILIGWREGKELKPEEKRIHRTIAGEVPYPQAGHEVKPWCPEVEALILSLKEGSRLILPRPKTRQFRANTVKLAIPPERQQAKKVHRKEINHENRSYDPRHVSHAPSLRKVGG